MGTATSLFNLHKSSTKQNLWSNYLITVILTSGQEAAWMRFRKVLFSIQIHHTACFPFQTSQLLFIRCQDDDYWYYGIIPYKKKRNRVERMEWRAGQSSPCWPSPNCAQTILTSHHQKAVRTNYIYSLMDLYIQMKLEETTSSQILSWSFLSEGGICIFQSIRKGNMFGVSNF